MVEQPEDAEQFSDQELIDAEIALESSGLLPERPKVEQDPEEFSDDQLIAADEEVRKFGTGKEIAKAALEGAARGATLGLSDLAVPDKAATFARQIENPIVSTISDIGTTVGATLLTGGGALAARGAAAGASLGAKQVAKQVAKAATSPVLLTEKLARAAGKRVGSAISKETGRKKFIQEVVSKAAEKGAEFATEGAIYAAGRAISDDALGKSDLTAENFVAQVGAGALLGGGIGGALGVGKATLPAIKNLTAPISSRISKGLDKLSSPEEAAMNIAGLTPSQIVKLEKNVKDFKPRSVEYFRKIINEVTDDAETISKANNVFLDSSTKRLKSVVSEIDESTKRFPEILPSRIEFYSPIIRDLDEITDSFKGLGKTSKELTAPVEKLASDLRRAATNKKPLSFSEIESQRKLIGKIIQKQKRAADPTLALEGARTAYSAYRRQIDQVASRVESIGIDSRVKNLARDLKNINSDIELGLTFADALAKKAEKSGEPTVKELLEMLTAFNLAGATGALVGIGKVAFKRNTLQNLALKGDLAVANNNIKNKISDFVPAIVGAAALPARAAKVTSFYALSDSGLSSKKTESGKVKVAKNDLEAYKNIKQNLSDYAANSEVLEQKLIRATSKLNAHVPEIGSHVADSLSKAVYFLYKKMPKDPSGSFNYPFEREYQPSTLELAKFKRYVQAVESPTSILDEALKGTLTREHVEAVKEVYPVLYSEIRSSIYDYMSEKGEDLNISYNKKILIGSLLDLPLDQSLQPDFILNLQSSISSGLSPSSEIEKSAVNTTVGGLKDLKIAERARTESQSVVSRERS